MIARCVPLAFVALVWLTSCRKPAVESYRVPKEASTEAAAPASDPSARPALATNAPAAPTGAAPGAAAPTGSAMANTAVPTSSGAGLAWSAPAAWKTKVGSAMRKGSYSVTADGVPGEADLSITAFPGAVGGDLANFNRWRGQVGLGAASQAEFDSSTEKLDRNGLRLIVVDIVGTTPSQSSGKGESTRILGAMVPYAGDTWFFKLMGPDALVAKAKPAFMAFLETVKPAAK